MPASGWFCEACSSFAECATIGQEVKPAGSTFAILIYADYLKAKDKDKLAPGLHIPTGTSPIFLTHGGEDIISSPEQSVFMHLVPKRAGIPAELHIRASTAHDFGVRTRDRRWSPWTESCAHWLRHHGFLKFQP